MKKQSLIIAATKRQNCEMLVQAMLSDAIQARPILMDPLSQCSIIKNGSGMIHWNNQVLFVRPRITIFFSIQLLDRTSDWLPMNICNGIAIA